MGASTGKMELKQRRFLKMRSLIRGFAFRGLASDEQRKTTTRGTARLQQGFSKIMQHLFFQVHEDFTRKDFPRTLTKRWRKLNHPAASIFSMVKARMKQGKGQKTASSCKSCFSSAGEELARKEFPWAATKQRGKRHHPAASVFRK